MSDEQLLFIRRKGGLVLLYGGRQFYRNKTYKNGSAVWVCRNKKTEGCHGSVTLEVSSFLCKCKTIASQISFKLFWWKWLCALLGSNICTIAASRNGQIG